MRPEWAEAGRQYLSTGTLKSCKYLILAVLFLFSFFEKPAPDWQSFHLRLICWIIKRNLTLLRGQVVDLQTQPWRLQRNSERTRRSWPNMRLKLKVKLFKAPQMFSCSTTRRDLASNLCLLYCVLCLIWLGVMHPIFSVTLTSPILPGVKDRLAFAFHQPFEKVVIVQTWRITFCVYK